MTIPAWIYFAMGAVIARIVLEGTHTQGYRLMDWFTLVFNILRIVVLWPLVLFGEKIEAWLKAEPPVIALANEAERAAPVFAESWEAVPIPTTGGGEVKSRG